MYRIIEIQWLESRCYHSPANRWMGCNSSEASLVPQRWRRKKPIGTERKDWYR